DESFISRALRLFGREPVIPVGIDLSDWAGLLTSVQRRYPLLMIETEKKEPGCGFIGRVVKQTARRMVLETVNTQGRWADKQKFAFKDITQVVFDDGYVNALADLIMHEAA